MDPASDAGDDLYRWKETPLCWAEWVEEGKEEGLAAAVVAAARAFSRWLWRRRGWEKVGELGGGGS